MTSSNGNIFRVTGHLCGEFTGHRWIPHTNGQWRGALMLSLICNGWVNNREAGELRRYRSHYDVIVMKMYDLHLCTLWVESIGHWWILVFSLLWTGINCDKKICRWFETSCDATVMIMISLTCLKHNSNINITKYLLCRLSVPLVNTSISQTSGWVKAEYVL